MKTSWRAETDAVKILWVMIIYSQMTHWIMSFALWPIIRSGHFSIWNFPSILFLFPFIFEWKLIIRIFVWICELYLSEYDLSKDIKTGICHIFGPNTLKGCYILVMLFWGLWNWTHQLVRRKNLSFTSCPSPDAPFQTRPKNSIFFYIIGPDFPNWLQGSCSFWWTAQVW